ncbi:thiol-disulfide oxidoreductase ResA [Cytobacillus firmus]|uniref:Thiol-disulfide oxidoreductase n=1 Tax=Cytobacillus firmus DS1 TaxID=1307436 RepID=W7L9P7_CYTFI|nr:thiol-disulfide oxidoreductase ResA [Cytobacillus firmus]EWG08544.1 thiol-disulfide oxidoreductase [Cytobacillus firmus DS1]MBG9549696.1 thiol-disulfide oxidoreductase [Cytobacillus firmus]MBG9604050.1 thiol-disulfide oxidoreductase [Cytobacillus firmus]MED1942727.1 thiol-disulfide oxidoreductase ResA [Cytobacillus firmus]
MKRKRLVIRSVILLLLFGAVGYTLYANFTKDKNVIAEGTAAPDFSLETLDGERMKLSDLRGKGVFLNFWGTWCKPCEKEMPYMENQYKKLKDKGVEILAVNIDESDFSVSTFVKRHNLTFPILMDRGSIVTELYNIGPIPTTILIDKNGKVVKVLTGTMTEDDINNYMKMIAP